MAETTVQSIRFKRGTKQVLIDSLTTAKSNLLLSGEPAFETDTGQLKIGNGTSDYIDLPYVGGTDSRFVIQDPEDGQVLLYDSVTQKWVNKDLADTESIIYLAERGLTLKGYDSAANGQMLVKDATNGITWTTPVSTETLNELVAAASKSASDAANSATAATSSENAAAVSEENAHVSEVNAASSVTTIQNWVGDKFKWMTVEEYNSLTEIKEGTFYFIYH